MIRQIKQAPRFAILRKCYEANSKKKICERTACVHLTLKDNTRKETYTNSFQTRGENAYQFSKLKKKGRRIEVGREAERKKGRK